MHIDDSCIISSITASSSPTNVRNTSASTHDRVTPDPSTSTAQPTSGQCSYFIDDLF